MFDIALSNLDFDLLLRIFSIIILLPTQLWLCFKVKKRLIRLLPILILVVLGIIFIILASIATGWDALGYLIFAIYTGYMIAICVIGWIVWWIVQRKKRA